MHQSQLSSIKNQLPWHELSFKARELWGLMEDWYSMLVSQNAGVSQEEIKARFRSEKDSLWQETHLEHLPSEPEETRRQLDVIIRSFNESSPYSIYLNSADEVQFTALCSARLAVQERLSRLQDRVKEAAAGSVNIIDRIQQAMPRKRHEMISFATPGAPDYVMQKAVFLSAVKEQTPELAKNEQFASAVNELYALHRAEEGTSQEERAKRSRVEELSARIYALSCWLVLAPNGLEITAIHEAEYQRILEREKARAKEISGSLFRF